MGQVLRRCFGTSTSVDEPTTPQQIPPRARGARVPSSQQIYTSVRRPLWDGRARTSRKPRKRSSLLNAPPSEGSSNLPPVPPHSIRAPPPVASSSSRIHPDTSAGTPKLPGARIPRPLTSALCQAILEIPKFRILVVGKSSSGKSSLIRAAFSVDVPATPGRALEETDINFEHSSEDNRYLIVHKCSGLGTRDVDSQSFQNIRDFISHRTDTSRSASERLHAVWICVPASDVIDGNVGEGIKEILLTLRTRNVPVILVLTKFDVVVSDVLSKMPRGDARLARVSALQMCEDSCRRHFDKSLRELPAETVSGKPNFADLVENVVVTTDGFIPGARDRKAGFALQGERQRTSAERLVWSAALRVCRDIVIQASIEVGQSGYWHNLGSKVEFDNQTLKDCVNIIHGDLVELWNVSNKDMYLSSDEFKAKMSHLVKDLAKSHSQESGAKVGFAKWVYGVYNGRPDNICCLMGYIVNLMVILDAIFSTTSGDISREDVLRVMERHINSGYKGIHCDIRDFVTTFANKFSVPPKDLILERIIDLIQKFCVPPTGTSLIPDPRTCPF